MTTHQTDRKGEQPAMRTPPIVSRQEWEAAREQLLVKEKAQMRARDALAAERRRMPWMAVEKAYQFEGPQGKVSLLDLFEGRRQLIVYRAFFEPGVFGWPEHACRGCSLGADQVAHLAHLNARDTTLVYASLAPQADIVRLKGTPRPRHTSGGTGTTTTGPRLRRTRNGSRCPMPERPLSANATRRTHHPTASPEGRTFRRSRHREALTSVRAPHRRWAPGSLRGGSDDVGSISGPK